MADFNPFDMDRDGDVDGIDFLGFDYFMRHGPGRAAGSARGHTSTYTLASLIGIAVLLVTVVFACLICTLTLCSAS